MPLIYYTDNNEFIEILEQIERLGACSCLPKWAYIPVTSHPYLPVYHNTSIRLLSANISHWYGCKMLWVYSSTYDSAI